jgi:PHD/YefM family antitoxin component YafN of YafNO toxin-antitoxin module
MTGYLSDETEQMPIVKARAMLTRLPERLAESNQAVALTRRGKPVLAVMSWDLFESLIETMEVMADPELMAVLRRDIERVDEQPLIPLDQLKAQLDDEEMPASRGG